MKITKSLLLASLTSTLLASTTHHTERHWDYSGEYGPENWGIFSEVCKTGKLQTPINIETSKVKHLEEDILGFKNYVTDVNAHVINNGHTIKVVPRGIYAGITVDGEFFKLLQFHMHTHSESTIDEVRSDLVVHLVHKSNHNELAVVGVFFDVGEKNEDVTHYWDSMPKHTGEMEEIEEEFETMFVFIDAFSTSIETVINEIYFNFGLESNFIGGGAGSLSFVQKPVLYTNSGLVEDGVTLTTIEEVSGIGVKHGWESIDGAFQITKANKNVIEELDYKPAFEVYKEVVEKHSNMEFREDNFFDIAKGYPFGISKIGTEKIVRDPISEEGGKLVCVGNVKDGDYVDILHGEKDGLVSAVKIAYSEGSGKLESDVKFTLFIDCISRVLYLEDSFQEELDAVATKDSILVGALTLGEIANTGSDYLEFYNKTAVVGVF
jgi:carbonic anhydrase